MVSYRIKMMLNALMNPNKTSIWKSLEDHAQEMALKPLPLTAAQKNCFNASSCNIHLDYSKQHLTSQTLALLFKLADSCALRNKITNLMRGEIVNFSEQKPALHTALRASGVDPILVKNQNIMPDILVTRKKMYAITEQIRNNQWLGFSGKPITDIVNIGIGGSDLGPRFAITSLENYLTKHLGYHFISDADPNSFDNTVAKLKPETTLFIISSKSFTTQETIYNARKAMQWIGPQHAEKHFIGVTAHPKKAHQFGIRNVLPIWDWIGGRYSFCSAINLITVIAIGFEQFEQILMGARTMDQHFLQSDYSTNLPILLALIGIWNNNFLHIHNLLTWTYTQLFEQLVPYIQQLDMESNGKSINNQGQAVNYATGPIIWGGMGNQAQHSYYQLLCQGTHKTTVDFISLEAFSGKLINQICEAKIKVLTTNTMASTPPINDISISNYSPFTVGALVALYEHKIFTQSVIWDINPFDQPGVESAKYYYQESTKDTNKEFS